MVCIGRFNAWKGQNTLADAWDMAFADVPEPPPLTFVGSEALPSPFAERAMALEHRRASKPWRILPFRPDVSDILAESQLLVLPSERPEPFGNVILEALQAGCDVIAFEGGGPDDLSRAFPGSVTTVARDTESLSIALKRWWASHPSDPEPGRHTGTLERHYSEDAAVAAWRELLEQIGAAQPASRPRAREGDRAH